MRYIEKTISLEQFKSRIPLLYNSYDNGTLVDFSSIPLSGIYEQYPIGNYNMIPCNLKLSEDFISDINNSVSTEVNTLKTEKINQFGFPYLDSSFDYTFDIKSIAIHYDGFYSLTYYTIKKMFYFFKKYDSILANGIDKFVFNVSECDRKCKTALEYFNVYIKNNSFYNDYVDLDLQYFAYGGSEMKKFLYKNVFQTFEIPKDYVHEWKTDHLWVVDALKWKYWFEERNELYSGITDCMEAEDCCECARYFKLGGLSMYELLSSYIENINIMNFEIDIENTSIFNPLLVTNSIDDIGEYSIFSTDWEGGVDYSSQKFNSGSVVTYDNDVFINTKNKRGYDFLDDCKDFKFDEETWKSYFLHKHEDPFSGNTVYSYKEDGTFVIGTSIEPEDMALSAECTVKEEIYYNNEYYEIESEVEILIYDNVFEKTYVYRVLRDSFNKRYVIHKGKKYYAKTNRLGAIVFDLWTIPCVREKKTGCEKTIQTKKIVQISNNIYYVGNGNKYIEIDGMNYGIIEKHVTINNQRYNLIDDKIVSTLSLPSSYTDFSQEDTSYFGEYVAILKNKKCYTISDNIVFKYLNPYVVYEVNKITGTTDSKLDLFKDTNVFCDDIGEKLDGKFKIKPNETYFAQPLENTCLDLFYEVGNVSRLSTVYTSETQTTTNLYWGDILTEMEFYYVDNNNEITTSIYKASANNNDNIVTVDKLIDEWIVNHEEDFDKETFNFLKRLSGKIGMPIDIIKNNITDNLVCKFTYHLGAIIEKDLTTKTFKLWDNAKRDFTSGVKYTEEYYLNLIPTKYNITQNLSYNIYYYSLQPLERTQALYHTENGSIINENPKAKFEAKINTEILNETLPYKITYSKYNNTFMAPVFREEYKFGISSLQKVEENVYIERGIMKPMDMDLRLIELTTMEDLIQYGNGYFKIINNS